MAIRSELPPLRDHRLDAASAMCRAQRRVCCAPGCDNRTSHAKPYCMDHLQLMPYLLEVRPPALSAPAS